MEAPGGKPTEAQVLVVQGPGQLWGKLQGAVRADFVPQLWASEPWEVSRWGDHGQAGGAPATGRWNKGAGERPVERSRCWQTAGLLRSALQALVTSFQKGKSGPGLLPSNNLIET